MRYFIKRVIDGDFSGHPDTECVEVSENEYVAIWNLFKGRWKNVCPE